MKYKIFTSRGWNSLEENLLEKTISLSTYLHITFSGKFSLFIFIGWNMSYICS